MQKMVKKTVLPITVEQSVFAKARAIYGPKAQIQETDIRVESVLGASKVSTTFNLNGDGINQRPTEQFIGRNDLVILYALMVGIQKVETAGGLALGNGGNYQTYTYPDLSVFNTAAVAPAVSEAAALMAIYNGAISMRANTYELLNKERLNRFYRAPETQFNLANSTQAQMSDNRFVHIAQPAILSGRDTNVLEFEQAQGADTTLIGGDTTKAENVLVFHFKAVTIRNGAQPTTWSEVEALQLKKRLDAQTVNGRILL